MSNRVFAVGHQIRFGVLEVVVVSDVFTGIDLFTNVPTVEMLLPNHGGRIGAEIGNSCSTSEIGMRVDVIN